MSNNQRDSVLACAQVLADHNGKDTMVLDLTDLSMWTDFFILTTATSSAHLAGLVRHLSENLAEQGLAPVRKPHVGNDEEWCLVDAGWFVVHVMSARAREFYDLEKLWFQAKAINVVPSEGPRPAESEGNQAQTI